MAQLYKKPTFCIAEGKLSLGILNNDPAALPPERLDVVNIDSTCWLAEKHLIILDVCRQICTGLAIYSSKEFEAIYCSLNNAKTISDILAIQASLRNTHEPRSADEKALFTHGLT